MLSESRTSPPGPDGSGCMRSTEDDKLVNIMNETKSTASTSSSGCSCAFCSCFTEIIKLNDEDLKVLRDRAKIKAVNRSKAMTILRILKYPSKTPEDPTAEEKLLHTLNATECSDSENCQHKQLYDQLVEQFDKLYKETTDDLRNRIPNSDSMKKDQLVQRLFQRLLTQTFVTK